VAVPLKHNSSHVGYHAEFRRSSNGTPKKTEPSREVAFRLSRSSKVIESGSDQSATYDFLLAIHCNHWPISYRFRSWSKTQFFPNRSVFKAPSRSYHPGIILDKRNWGCQKRIGGEVPRPKGLRVGWGSWEELSWEQGSKLLPTSYGSWQRCKLPAGSEAEPIADRW